MSKRKIGIGTTLGDAMNFAVGNIVKVIGMTWLPMVVMIGVLVGGFIWTFEMDLEQLEDIADAVEASEILLPWQVPAPGDDVQTEPATGGAGRDAAKPTGGGQTAKPSDQELLEALFEGLPPVNPSRLLIAIPLGVFALLVLQTIPIVGYTRMQLRGKAPILWPFYFRLGPTEIRLTITLLLISILVTFAALAVILPSVLIFGGATGMQVGAEQIDPETALLVIPAAVLIALVFFSWLLARMCLAVPIAVNDGGIGIARGWRASKGHGFSLTISVMVAFLVIIAVSVLVQIVFSVVTLPFSLASEAASEPRRALTTVVVIVGIATALLTIALQGFQNAFFYGLFTSAYKQLNEGPSDE